jgi:hypothetical protein
MMWAGMPLFSEAAAMAASITKKAWGPPKPRKAVKGGRLVRHMEPVTLTAPTR